MLKAAEQKDARRARVLVVDDAPEMLRSLERTLCPHFDVVTAQNGDEALCCMELEGPFSVVVSDYEMPGMKGTEFLAEVFRQWPESVAIMLTGVVNVDVAIRALHSGRILRFLEKPCPQEGLLAAVEAGVAEYRRRVDARLLEHELEFSRDALWDFNATLTTRIREQTQSLHKLNQFVGELNSAESLDLIAKLAAESVSGLLRGRAVHVQLGSSLGELTASALAGGEMSSERHVEEVIAAEGPVGLFVVDRHDAEQRDLTAAQRELVQAIASATAVATYNVLRRLERDEAQQATILALARLAEQRDNETGKHLERVSLFCRLIAEGLREDGQFADTITDAWIQDLARSAPLHDIGKVGIPDAILLKPAKLTPAEWAIMKRHTEIGAQTLRGVIAENRNQSFLQMSLDIAWCHHEKWDGSGYPRGLAGNDIPLSARILALADVYDALTTVRPYKQAWDHERAIEWIREGLGSHFDPTVAQAFLARAAQADFIRARLADAADDLVGCQRVLGMAS
ncbi:MAG TPA: HD domain-containing phosphohydrolase [Planctomycetota bacterium]|nr:HD domain-containing phosphohydrolase [Planctomycetota bacterium]